MLPSAKESSEPSPLGLFTANRFLIDNAYKPALDLKITHNEVKRISITLCLSILSQNIEVKLGDYLLLPTMEETFREIVTSVIHRKVDRQSAIRVHLPDEKRWGTENPLFIVDGVITDDIDYLMSLKPLDITVIKVMNSRKKHKCVGAIGENGVRSLRQNSKQCRECSASDVDILCSRYFPVASVHECHERKFPAASARNKILLVLESGSQESMGKAKLTFSFYTADNTGTFRIVMDGLTEKGEPVSAVQNITVKRLSAQ